MGERQAPGSLPAREATSFGWMARGQHLRPCIARRRWLLADFDEAIVGFVGETYSVGLRERQSYRR